jgi:hypothetical protein
MAKPHVSSCPSLQADAETDHHYVCTCIEVECDECDGTGELEGDCSACFGDCNDSTGFECVNCGGTGVEPEECHLCDGSGEMFASPNEDAGTEG